MKSFAEVSSHEKNIYEPLHRNNLRGACHNSSRRQWERPCRWQAQRLFWWRGKWWEQLDAQKPQPFWWIAYKRERMPTKDGSGWRQRRRPDTMLDLQNWHRATPNVHADTSNCQSVSWLILKRQKPYPFPIFEVWIWLFFWRGCDSCPVKAGRTWTGAQPPRHFCHFRLFLFPFSGHSLGAFQENLYLSEL